MNNKTAIANRRAIGYSTAECCTIRFIWLVVRPYCTVLYCAVLCTATLNKQTRQCACTMRIRYSQTDRSIRRLKNSCTLSNERLVKHRR